MNEILHFQLGVVYKKHTCFGKNLEDSALRSGMDSIQLLRELQESESNGNLQVLRKLIVFSLKNQSDDKDLIKWQPILVTLLEILTANEKVEKERILLTSHSFLVILITQCSVNQFENNLKSYLMLETNELYSFDRQYNVRSIELFKLIIVYGYSQVNESKTCSLDICSLSFDVIYRNCICYTRYSYFAYKVLQVWLCKTMKINFWNTNNLILEQKLETIIFANWDNSIKEINKQNATVVFNKYLKIMKVKYNDFLRFAFECCVSNISWQNKTKYNILAEICNVWNDIKAMTATDFIICLFTSLTRNYLRSVGTRVYNTISDKLSEDQWKEAFGYPIKVIVTQWESDSKRNYNALQLFCKHWLEPTIIKHKDILPFLWELSNETNGILYRSHLERIASKMNVRLSNKFIPTILYIDHYEEFIRINSFAIHCQNIYDIVDDNNKDPFYAVKQFLFFNANANTIFLRNGIKYHFKIFLVNIIKLSSTYKNFNRHILNILDWLHEFLLDCFEIGSCYQRKILGLNMYKIILFYTNSNRENERFTNDPRYKESLKHGLTLGKRLKASGKWKFTNKQSLVMLLKLVLDSTNDIREISANIVFDNFDKNSLTDSEKQVLLNTAITKCNSSKFYETESGATLMKLITYWLPPDEDQNIEISFGESLEINNCLKLNSSYIDSLLIEAQKQLEQIKQDILKAVIQGSPFYGILTAILTIGFRGGPECTSISPEYSEKLLGLLENAVNFLLSVLSSKSNNSEYSSSFAEMGLAIDETIKDSVVSVNFDEVVLSPAHQVVISCIWTSLKISCEIASEIGTLFYSEEITQRSGDLIISVLIKCRHKGAIEAAGLAIGHLTRNLCKEDKFSKLPETYLRNLLKNDCKNNPKLTRRGAGLSIMFHRIVASDDRRDRPLVHIAIRILLDSLKNSFETSSSDVECSHDSPCARYLHFLCALVADSELHAQLVFYLEEISLTCFKYLQSKTWTIRNASLQLFGAVVSRLTGQCIDGRLLHCGDGYSVNHFITHYPVLASHLLQQLQRFSRSIDTTLEIQSSIVHILILLSRMSTGGCDFMDYSSRMYTTDVKCKLQVLFANPIGHIRILTAKAYAALVPFSQIITELENLKEIVLTINRTNQIHGYLCAMKYLNEKLINEMKNANPHYKIPKFTEYKEMSNQIWNDTTLQDYYEINRIHKIDLHEFSRKRPISEFWKHLYDSKKNQSPCYIVETLLLELSNKFGVYSMDLSLFDQIGQNDRLFLSFEKIKPGFFEFIGLSMYFYAAYVKCTGDIDMQTVHKILGSQCIDQSISFLNHLSCYTPLFEIVLDYMLNSFQTCNKALLDAMINFLFETVKHVSLSSVYNSKLEEKVHTLIVKTEGDGKNSKLEQLSYILTIMFSSNDSLVSKAVSYVLMKSFDTDEKIRRLAAECMQYLLYRFTQLDNKNKLAILQSYLTLLKDEVSDIRELVTNNFQFLTVSDDPVTNKLSRISEVIYYEILIKIVLNESQFAVFSTDEILKFFETCIDTMNCPKIVSNTENPFDHDDDGFYREETKLLNIIFYSINSYLYRDVRKNDKTDKTSNSNLESVSLNDIVQAKYQLQRESGVDFIDLQTTLNLKYTDYLSIKKKIVMNVCGGS